jgi:proteasome accessory factor B
VKVELLFSPKAARRALENRWHPSQTTEKLRDGRVRIILEVRGAVEITPWILSWGADVEVISPKPLRSQLAAIAGEMAGNYSPKPGSA